MKNVMKLWMVLMLLGMGQMAYAIAPANLTITNTATLTYTGNAGGTQATISVLVLLTPATPTVINATNVTVAEGQTATLTYTLRSNANGPDSYAFTAPSSVASNVTGSGAPSTPVNITLGASAANIAIVANAGAVVIVPVDQNAADNIVNGIAATDTIVIGGNVYTVLSVAENAGTGDATITLTANVTTAVAFGDLIVEQQTFDVTIVAGTINVGFTTGTETVSVIARDAAALAPASAAGVGVVNVVQAVFIKSVSIDNGVTFVTTTPNVVSGDTVIYRLLLQVPAGTSLNNVVFTDAVPAFMTYVANSTTVDDDGPTAAVSTPVAVADIVGVSPLVTGLTMTSIGQGTAGDVVGGGAGAEVSAEFQVIVD